MQKKKWVIFHGFLNNLNLCYNPFRYEFLRTSATELHDGGRHLMMKQRGFQLINPTEKWFPGLVEIRNNFSAWDWCYGKTPKFTVQKEVQLKSDERDHHVQLKIAVNAVKLLLCYYFTIHKFIVIYTLQEI